MIFAQPSEGEGEEKHTIAGKLREKLWLCQGSRLQQSIALAQRPGRPRQALTVQFWVFLCIFISPCEILAQAALFATDEHCSCPRPCGSRLDSPWTFLGVVQLLFDGNRLELRFCPANAVTRTAHGHSRGARWWRLMGCNS